jgi:hypothetical protein
MLVDAEVGDGKENQDNESDFEQPVVSPSLWITLGLNLPIKRAVREQNVQDCHFDFFTFLTNDSGIVEPRPVSNPSVITAHRS